MNETKKRTERKFGGYGINADYDDAVLVGAREIFDKLTDDGGDWDVYPIGCEGSKNINGRRIYVSITTATDYNDATGFEIWLNARVTKRVQKIFCAADIDKAIAWIAKKTELIAQS